MMLKLDITIKDDIKLPNSWLKDAPDPWENEYSE